MPSAAAIAGWAMMALAAVLVAVGLVAAVPSWRRARRAARALARVRVEEGSAVEVLLEVRSDLLIEYAELVRPLRLVGRVLRHPLTRSVVRSLRLRRQARHRRVAA